MTRASMVGALASAAGWTARVLPGLAGAALISVAACMVYLPAGLAVAGVFCLLADGRQR